MALRPDGLAVVETFTVVCVVAVDKVDGVVVSIMGVTGCVAGGVA